MSQILLLLNPQSETLSPANSLSYAKPTCLSHSLFEAIKEIPFSNSFYRVEFASLLILLKDSAI